MDGWNSAIRTFVPSLMALTIVGSVIAILNTGPAGDKLFALLSRKRRTIVGLLTLLIIVMPLIISLSVGKNLFLQEASIYIRELFLSILFLLSFVATWIVLHNFRAIWQRIIMNLHHKQPVAQEITDQEEIGLGTNNPTICEEPSLWGNAFPESVLRRVVRQRDLVTIHEPNGGRVYDANVISSQLQNSTSLPRSAASHNGIRIYTPDSIQAASRAGDLPRSIASRNGARVYDTTADQQASNLQTDIQSQSLRTRAVGEAPIPDGTYIRQIDRNARTSVYLRPSDLNR